jgi:hypothetical protein
MAKPNVAHAMALIAWRAADPATRGECPVHPSVANMVQAGRHMPKMPLGAGTAASLAWGQSSAKSKALAREEAGYMGPTPNDVIKRKAYRKRGE